jgi:hypothetical protein
MASLADPGEWLVMPFAVILTVIVLLQGSMTVPLRTDPRDTGVCERPHFFLPFH